MIPDINVVPAVIGTHFYYNFSYFYLLLPALIIAVIAQIAVKRAYSKMSSVYSKSGYSGAQAAQAVLRYYGISDVRIEQCSGRLSDHYDPRHKVIRLSEGVFSSTSIAAIGIACHEAGHAAQHAEKYLPIRVRNSILPVCNIGSRFSIPLRIPFSSFCRKASRTDSLCTTPSFHFAAGRLLFWAFPLFSRATHSTPPLSSCGFCLRNAAFSTSTWLYGPWQTYPTRNSCAKTFLCPSFSTSGPPSRSLCY